jgi:hypothetical protein
LPLCLLCSKEQKSQSTNVKKRLRIAIFPTENTGKMLLLKQAEPEERDNVLERLQNDRMGWFMYFSSVKRS